MQSGGATDVFDFRSTLKMEATGSSDTVETYETTRRHMPEDDNIQTHCRKNVKSLSISKSGWIAACGHKGVSKWEGLRPYMGVATPGTVPTLIPNFSCRSTDWLLLSYVGVPRRAGVESDVGLERSDVGVRL
jgi:hypothetical protein